MLYKLLTGLSVTILIISISCKKTTTSSNNTNPTASFTISPTSGTTATTFTFDASGSTDNEDAKSVLQVRWDWDNDGIYDTDFSTTKTATHQYGTIGIYTIKLEVTDSGGLTNSTTNPLSVEDDSSICSGIANYTVTFVSTWSSSTHPTDFPSTPHFSGLIGAIHNGNVTFWSEGEIATAGIESMAENGHKTELIIELTAAINAGNAHSILSGGGINPSPGSVSLQFDVTSDHSKITLVSMVAPSPDWFVGVSNLNLCENGDWINNKTIDLNAYDAGTDSGNSYTSSDEDSNPKENITKLTTGVFYVNDSIPRLGTFTFVKN